MIQLVVQFYPEFDVTYTENAFRSPSTKVIDQLNGILGTFADAKVEPLFSGNMGDVPAHMRYYYVISLADADRARSLEHLLQQQTFVEGAYIKPPAELP